ncbi:MAG: hypothetical protein H7Y00_01020 [Fimbriimonadaceae bacterium]|nr:hypothetical protein [Chitinophagales bacterium]
MKKIHIKNFLRGQFIFAVFVIIFMMQTSCSSSQNNSLDGKTFSIQTMEKDKQETAVAETCLFEAGFFDNIDCHQYGFSKGKYKADRAGEDLINFEATMESEKEGKMIWKGEVDHGKLKGEMVWKKEGQADVAFTFSGTIK